MHGRRGLGFGTYLAYFSQLLSNPAWDERDEWDEKYMFLMNEEMTEEEKEIRQYMILVLTNLAQGQKLTNISIWELAKYLHANPDEYLPDFSRPLQDEFGCNSHYTQDSHPEAASFMGAWEYYSKAYFAVLCNVRFFRRGEGWFI